jgi:hypothetical protein
MTCRRRHGGVELGTLATERLVSIDGHTSPVLGGGARGEPVVVVNQMQVGLEATINDMIAPHGCRGRDQRQRQGEQGRRVWPKERVSVLSCLRGCWVLSAIVARGRATI